MNFFALRDILFVMKERGHGKPSGAGDLPPITAPIQVEDTDLYRYGSHSVADAPWGREVDGLSLQDFSQIIANDRADISEAIAKADEALGRMIAAKVIKRAELFGAFGLFDSVPVVNFVVNFAEQEDTRVGVESTDVLFRIKSSKIKPYKSWDGYVFNKQEYFVSPEGAISVHLSGQKDGRRVVHAGKSAPVKFKDLVTLGPVALEKMQAKIDAIRRKATK